MAAILARADPIPGRPVLSDVNSDHFLVPANGRDKISSRPELVAEKIPHLAFDILRDPDRTLPRFG